MDVATAEANMMSVQSDCPGECVHDYSCAWFYLMQRFLKCAQCSSTADVVVDFLLWLLYS